MQKRLHDRKLFNIPFVRKWDKAGAFDGMHIENNTGPDRLIHPKKIIRIMRSLSSKTFWSEEVRFDKKKKFEQQADDRTKQELEEFNNND